jgi:hypothetical protein
MQHLDSLQIQISNQIISINPQNFNKSDNQINDVEYTSFKLKPNLLTTGINNIYVNDSHCNISISSKLIPEQYYDMITNNNIERYLNGIIATGLIQFNANEVIENAIVLTCDTTNNIPNIKDVATYINPLLVYRVNDRYICKLYKDQSIGFIRDIKYKKKAEQIRFYDKHLELFGSKKSEDKKFLRQLNPEQFRDVLRVESKFKTAKQMRKYFNVKSVTLLDILNSPASVNYNIFNKITDIKNISIESFENFKTFYEMREQKIKRATIEKRAGMMKIIEMLNSDIRLIKLFINTGSSEKSNNSAVIKDYKQLIKAMDSVSINETVDQRVNEIKQYLKVA